MGTDLEVAILFADVVGSTQLFDELGDVRAREMVGRCVEIMREATETSGGTVIKTIGDEIMATFPTADEAMNAARQMQFRIGTDESLTFSGGHVAIRIGCHFGPVVREQRDIFGAAVHTANRMTSQAKAGQILTTATTVERMSPDWKAMARQIDVAAVRGQSHEVAVHEILWQPEEATSMLPHIAGGRTNSPRQGARLTLSFQGREIALEPGGKQNVRLGRADDNDLVIKGNLISRLHARIELRRSRFFLIDESTNGTFVQTTSGEEIFVRRDSTELSGEGVIGLGRAAQSGTPLAVHYRLES